MNSTNLSALSNAELVASLEKLKGQETETTLSVLYHLVELDKRRYYRDLGFSSLFFYCTKRLGYSESSAGRRITAARCLREFPELAEMIRNSQVTLCTIAAAAQTLRTKSAKPADLCGKSKREVEALVANAAPAQSKPRQEIKPLAVKAPEMPLFAKAAESVRELKYSVPTGGCDLAQGAANAGTAIDRHAYWPRGAHLGRLERGQVAPMPS